MTTQPIPPKQALIAELRRTGDAVVAQLGALDESALEAGRYENGWNGRQILAHIASIEWTYPRLIELAKGPPPDVKAATTPPRQSPMASGSPQILGYNDRQVAKREGVSAADLLAEFKKNREATIAAVEATDDALFTKEITSAGGAQGPLASVFKFVAIDHVAGHLRDITGSA